MARRFATATDPQRRREGGIVNVPSDDRVLTPARAARYCAELARIVGAFAVPPAPLPVYHVAHFVKLAAADILTAADGRVQS